MSFAAVVAGGVGIGTSIASSVVKSNLAKKQKKEAQKLRDSESGIIANPIDNTFKENKMIAEKMALDGLMGKKQIQDKLTSQGANAIEKSKLATSNSGDLLSAISAQNNAMNGKTLDLGIADAEAKQRGLIDIENKNMAIAGEKARLEANAEIKRSALRRQANALEGASTENEVGATQDIIGGLGSAGGAVAGALNAKADEKFLTSLFKDSKVNPIEKIPFTPKADNVEDMNDADKMAIELGAFSKKRKEVDPTQNPIEDYVSTSPRVFPLKKKKK